MISSLLYLFPFQALGKIDLEVLDFWLFTELSTLEWFLTWYFKRATIPVLYVSIFKLQLLSNIVHVRFLQYVIFEVVVM